MRPGSNCLYRKVEHMISHQQRQLCYSTPTELLIKLVTAGAKDLYQSQIYLHQGIGDGFSKRENCSLSGRCFQMWPSRAESCGCKLGCRGGCSGTRVALKCTALCNYQYNNRWLQSVIRFNTNYRTMMWAKWNNFWWHDFVKSAEFCYNTS